MGTGFGPASTTTSAQAGLPFAGVPEELRVAADKIVAREPAHPEPAVRFERAQYDRRRFTLLRFLSSHRWVLAGAAALVIIETIALQTGGLLTRYGIDKGVVAKDTSAVTTAALAYLASVVVAALAGMARTAWTGRVGEGLLYDLRIRVFSHLQRLSLDFYTEERAGRVMTRMTSDIDALSQLLQDGVISLFVQALTLVVVGAILFSLQPTLALITIAVIVPPLTVVSLWFRSASDKGYRVVRERIADTLADLSENLSGVRVITAFNRARHNVVSHRNIAHRYRDANVHTARVNAIYGPSTDFVGNLGQLVVLALGASMVTKGTLTIGELAAFVLYLTAFFAPVQQLVQLYSTYQSGQAAVVKLAELLATQPDVPETPDAVDLPQVVGRIELRNVTFGYHPDHPILHDFSLDIAAGETMALVGATGAGKSTVAKLVTRFYDPTAGSVCIDGHDLRHLTFSSLRRQIGVVPQEPFLFVGTLRHNLSYGQPSATEAELLETCAAVGLTGLVARSSEGLDQPVHERGISFSSGERQLLALARAFLTKPRILILDEATSNLDLASEGMIERALDTVLEGRTAIIIAHRLATAMRADRIGVVDAGKLVEVGTHDDLVAADTKYAALYRTWLEHSATD